MTQQEVRYYLYLSNEHGNALYPPIELNAQTVPRQGEVISTHVLKEGLEGRIHEVFQVTNVQHHISFNSEKLANMEVRYPEVYAKRIPNSSH